RVGRVVSAPSEQRVRKEECFCFVEVGMRFVRLRSWHSAVFAAAMTSAKRDDCRCGRYSQGSILRRGGGRSLESKIVLRGRKRELVRILVISKSNACSSRTSAIQCALFRRSLS
ncbi:unnamed protein product, partial [Hapterophycus canaliculatus]